MKRLLLSLWPRVNASDRRGHLWLALVVLVAGLLVVRGRKKWGAQAGPLLVVVGLLFLVGILLSAVGRTKPGAQAGPLLGLGAGFFRLA